MDSITGESLADLPHYPSAVNCIRYFGDGRQLAVAIGDWMSNGRGEVALLNSVTGKTETTLRCPTSPGALTFASNEELIVRLWDGRTQLWNLVGQNSPCRQARRLCSRVLTGQPGSVRSDLHRGRAGVR